MPDENKVRPKIDPSYQSAPIVTNLETSALSYHAAILPTVRDVGWVFPVGILDYLLPRNQRCFPLRMKGVGLSKPRRLDNPHTESSQKANWMSSREFAFCEAKRTRRRMIPAAIEGYKRALIEPDPSGIIICGDRDGVALEAVTHYPPDWTWLVPTSPAIRPITSSRR